MRCCSIKAASELKEKGRDGDRENMILPHLYYAVSNAAGQKRTEVLK